jgi:hypothetical protein
VNGPMDWIMERLMEWVLMPFCVLTGIALGVGMLVGIPYGLYAWATYKPPETFSLKVDSWSCTKSYEQDRQICTKGCYWVRETVCTQWSSR